MDEEEVVEEGWAVGEEVDEAEEDEVKELLPPLLPLPRFDSP